MRRFFITLTSLVLLLCVALVAAYTMLDNATRNSTTPHIYASVEEVPKDSVAMVLGAQVLPGKEPGKALATRLGTLIDAYKAEKISKVLMSGDGRSKYYNEVETMRSYALDEGIPDSAILLDPAGLRTYSSCYRAKHEYNLDKIVIITQADHLRRALYTCRSLGLDASGLVAPEFLDPQTNRTYFQYKFREKAALVLAWIDVQFLHPSL